ncbi:MAG: sulfite exporter TauE/SafE family protein [Candidatus Caldarchaeum sp.]
MVLVAEASVVVLAFFSALVGSMLGVGGGFVFVPVSVGIMGFRPFVAVPASLSLVLSNAFSATLTRLMKKAFNLRPNHWLVLPASGLSVLGALTSARLEAPVFKIMFGTFLLGSSLLLLRTRGIQEQDYPGGFVGRKLAIVVAAGFISSLLGVGGGLLMVPGFILLSKMSSREAVAVSQFLTGFTSATGLATYLIQGSFFPSLYVSAFAGGLLGGFVGSSIQIGLSEKQLKMAIASGFSAIGLWMLLSALL